MKSPFTRPFGVRSPFGGQAGDNFPVNLPETGADPIITAPVQQEIVTAGSAYTVLVTAPDDTFVRLYNGTTPIGDMTDLGGGSWSYSWTPSQNYNISLRARGNNSGWGETFTIVAAEANQLTQTMTSWTATRLTAASGQADPDGGTNAYKFTAGNNASTTFTLARTAGAAPSEKNSGFEIWVKPDGITKFMIYPSEDGGTHYAYFDLTNKYVRAVQAVANIIETSGSWYRIWFNYVNATSAGPRTYTLYACSTFGSTTATFTGTEAIHFYEPRTAQQGTLPFTEQQKLSVEYQSVSGGVESWGYTHPKLNTSADMTTTRLEIQVIKPTGWTNSGTYKVLYALPALNKSQEDFAATFTSGGYADTYNCVIVIPFCGRNFITGYWGVLPDGTRDEYGWLADVLTSFANSHLGGSTDPDDNLLVGYSKSANAAYHMLLRRPDKFGFAAGWDGTWEMDWGPAGTPGTALYYSFEYGFETEDQWRLFDPLTILPNYLSSVNDRTRLVLTGYETFQSDQVVMKAALDTYSIGYSYDATDTGNHSWAGGWLSDTLQRLFTISARTVTAQAGSYAFTGTDATLGLIIPTLLTAEAGSYSFTGTDATLNVNGVITMPADGGSYTFTGTDATLDPVTFGPTDGILQEDDTSYLLQEDGTSYLTQESA